MNKTVLMKYMLARAPWHAVKMSWSQITAIVGTLISYFLLGGAVLIQSYNVLAAGKLLILHLFLLWPLVRANTFVTKVLFKRKSVLLVMLVVVLYPLVGLALIQVLFRIGINLTTYIFVGDYLRDYHGINWYYMDLSGWELAILLYATQVVTAAVLYLVERWQPQQWFTFDAKA